MSEVQICENCEVRKFLGCFVWKIIFFPGSAPDVCSVRWEQLELHYMDIENQFSFSEMMSIPALCGYLDTLILNASHLEEKQKIPVLYSFVWFWPEMRPGRSFALIEHVIMKVEWDGVQLVRCFCRITAKFSKTVIGLENSNKNIYDGFFSEDL